MPDFRSGKVCRMYDILFAAIRNHLRCQLVKVNLFSMHTDKLNIAAVPDVPELDHLCLLQMAADIVCKRCGKAGRAAVPCDLGEVRQCRVQMIRARDGPDLPAVLRRDRDGDAPVALSVRMQMSGCSARTVSGGVSEARQIR